jgi:hypothetical protein
VVAIYSTATGWCQARVAPKDGSLVSGVLRSVGSCSLGCEPAGAFFARGEMLAMDGIMTMVWHNARWEMACLGGPLRTCLKTYKEE